MSNRRLTIGNSPAVQRLLRGRVSETDSPTAVLSRAADRYAALCERCLPHIEGEAWNVIYDALNGWQLIEDRDVQHAHAEIVDAIRLNGADKHHGANGAILIEQMQTWTYAEWVAVVDASERFWARHSEPDVHGDPRLWPDPQ